MKKVKTGALLLGLLLVLTGCGKNEAKDVDPSVLADTLRNAITFQDELEAVDAAAMGRMYEVDEADIEAFKVYTGTGATAEEIAVFKAKDEPVSYTHLDVYKRQGAGCPFGNRRHRASGRLYTPFGDRCRDG